MQEPKHFDHRVIGFRARVGVKYLATLKGGDLNELFGQHYSLVGHSAEEGVIAGKAIILIFGSLCEAGVIKSGHHIPKARVSV